MEATCLIGLVMDRLGTLMACDMIYRDERCKKGEMYKSTMQRDKFWHIDWSGCQPVGQKSKSCKKR